MVLAFRARLPLLIALLMSSTAVGCGDPASPTAPSVSQPSQPSQPGEQPGGLQPVVRTISPNAASTAGGSWGTIAGSEFQRGATVTLGKNVLRSVWVQDSETILFGADDPHAAGTVDVIVTNPGGHAARLIAGFTYAPPESFDFNGDWIAHAGPDYEIDMRFTIRNNELVSFSCGTSETFTPLAPTSVHSGEFSLHGDAGLVISGKVVSSVNAVGTIDIPACSAASWWADRK